MIADHTVAHPVALIDLVGDLGDLVGPGDVVVEEIAYDHRSVRPGTLFVCVSGSTADGHDHAREAVANGAVALVCERPLDLGVPELRVPSARVAMAPLSVALFGRPADSLQLVGVTGTNGKTTVTTLTAAIFEAAGRSAATSGTLTGVRTTPEAPDLQRQLATLLAGGVEVVVLEISSHALSQHRVDAMTVDLAVFTNLSRDHLEFHGTMEGYFQAKASLFQPDHARLAVVNLDDPYGRLLSDAAQIPTVGYRLDDAADIALGHDGSTFVWGGQRIHLGLVGSVNVSNALAAATAARELGIGIDAIAKGLASVEVIPGRFERVDLGAPFPVWVDFSHTPDALARLLEAGRELVPDGRLHLVFGCGGDRDPSKRAPMGEIASRLADHIVLTSDNPRSESPDAIIAEIRRGMSSPTDVLVEPDRRQAIAAALEAARAGDLVIVTGKGHETVQIVAEVETPFDDRLVVREEYVRITGSAS